MVSPALVLVDEGRVVDVDHSGADPPVGTVVVDLGDVTLMPGLVDAHLHLCFDASEDMLQPLQADDDATLVGRMEANAHATLAAGVTTARDLGDRRYVGLNIRERSRTEPTLPELLVAGPPITPTGGHCWFLGEKRTASSSFGPRW